MQRLTGWRVRNPVLALLVLAGLAAGLGLAFISQAPNRLVSGTGIGLLALLDWQQAWPIAPLLVLVLVLVAGVWLAPSRRMHALVAVAAGLLCNAWVWLAAEQAQRLALDSSAIARTSLGAGFWLLLLLSALALADAVQRLRLGAWAKLLVAIAVLLPMVYWGSNGGLESLSLAKEYRNRQDVFDAALARHLQIVVATLLPTLLLALPLGLAAQRGRPVARRLLTALGVVQTVPSIALFALLIAPLGALAAALPGLATWGLSGIGLAPAVVALTLYALLPVARSTAAGFGVVPRPVVDAARGMGLSASQVFWQIELPLALPLLLAGVRVCTVQTIGLAVVAALIGAGGFGAIVFQGLLSSALDLVLLGVLPVVALAWLADALFGAGIAWLQQRAGAE